MANTILWQLITLSLFTSFMGFCFCDGFKLHIARKIIWFVVFLISCIFVLKVKGEFDLITILPGSIILAAVLCVCQKIESEEKPR